MKAITAKYVEAIVTPQGQYGAMATAVSCDVTDCEIYLRADFTPVFEAIVRAALMVAPNASRFGLYFSELFF